jgi:hypothetical protein
MVSISFRILSRTISSAAESLASNRQFVIAAERNCIATEILGELIVIRLYEKKRVMEVMAKDVMGAEADEERMTCRKG